MLEQDEQALIWFAVAAAASPEMPTILAGLTSGLALTGRDTEARATLAQYLALEEHSHPDDRAMGLRSR